MKRKFIKHKMRVEYFVVLSIHSLQATIQTFPNNIRLGNGHKTSTRKLIILLNETRR